MYSNILVWYEYDIIIDWLKSNPVVQKEERGMVEMLVAAAVVLVDGATGVVEMAQTT